MVVCRSPENTLPSVGDLVAGISTDVSEASPQLLEDLLPQIKHAKEAVRSELSCLARAQLSCLRRWPEPVCCMLSTINPLLHTLDSTP